MPRPSPPSTFLSDGTTSEATARRDGTRESRDGTGPGCIMTGGGFRLSTTCLVSQTGTRAAPTATHRSRENCRVVEAGRHARCVGSRLVAVCCVWATAATAVPAGAATPAAEARPVPADPTAVFHSPVAVTGGARSLALHGVVATIIMMMVLASRVLVRRTDPSGS